jgi:hypothetical protein
LFLQLVKEFLFSEGGKNIAFDVLQN